MSEQQFIEHKICKNEYLKRTFWYNSQPIQGIKRIG